MGLKKDMGESVQKTVPWNANYDREDRAGGGGGTPL